MIERIPSCANCPALTTICAAGIQRGIGPCCARCSHGVCLSCGATPDQCGGEWGCCANCTHGQPVAMSESEYLSWKRGVHHLWVELERVRSERDPMRRGRLATEMLDTCQQHTVELAGIRRDAVTELRRTGASLEQIAAGLGVSKGRISQLRIVGQ